MKAFLGLMSFAGLVVYFFGLPLQTAVKQVRISDLTAVSEKGVTPEEMSKFFLAQATTTTPNRVVSGNMPNVYNSGNSPFAVTQGNHPNMVTRGNFPDRYTIGGLTSSSNGATFPMPKVNF
jgi:hypothetical protein